MVWGYIQYRGAREICKVDGNIDSAKYQQILASQYIPNYKRSFGMPARWPSMPSLTTSSTSSLPNRMATVLQAKGTHTRYELLNFKSMMKYYSFFICYFIYILRKIKCIDYNLIDYYLWQDFCPGKNRLVHHYQAINLSGSICFSLVVIVVSQHCMLCHLSFCGFLMHVVIYITTVTHQFTYCVCIIVSSLWNVIVS